MGAFRSLVRRALRPFERIGGSAPPTRYAEYSMGPGLLFWGVLVSFFFLFFGCGDPLGILLWRSCSTRPPAADTVADTKVDTVQDDYFVWEFIYINKNVADTGVDTVQV